MCDACCKVIQKTKQAAGKRTELERIMKIVEDDEEMELVDLPQHIRRRILKSDDFSLTKKDLTRERAKNKIHGSLSDDPACRSSHPEGAWVGAVYALYFPDELGLEKLVYVGLCVSGVMNRFKGHLSDARTRKENSTGNATYKSLLKRLQKENKQTSIRVQLLENYAYDSGVEEEKLTPKERIMLLELLEQKWQMRFFLSEFELLNASFKICTKSPIFQGIIRKDLASFDPDLHGIKDISKVGLGCYVGQEYRAGYAWNFVPFTEEELKASPYAVGTEIPESEQDSEEEDTKTEEESEPHLFVRQNGSVRPKEREIERLTKELAKYKEMIAETVAEAKKGLLTSEEFASACGTKGPPMMIEPTFKGPRGYDNYYHPDKVEEHKIHKQKSRSIKIENPEFGRVPSGNIRKIPLRKDNWTDPKPSVERRLKREASGYNTYSTARQRLADKFKKEAQDWINNRFSNPTTYLCKVCQKQRPFYDYYSQSRSKCKECQPASSTRDENTKSDAYIKTRVVTTFALAVKKDLSKGNNKYDSTPNSIIWNEIENILGYNKEQYLQHLEDQFEPWMDWSCWGRSRRNKDGKCWQATHIKPRSTCGYASMNAPEFKDSWSLANLKPLIEYLKERK